MNGLNGLSHMRVGIVVDVTLVGYVNIGMLGCVRVQCRHLNVLSICNQKSDLYKRM